MLPPWLVAMLVDKSIHVGNDVFRIARSRCAWPGCCVEGLLLLLATICVANYFCNVSAWCSQNISCAHMTCTRRSCGLWPRVVEGAGGEGDVPPRA